MSTHAARGRLSLETSPYLQQHADNPVDWYPWGEEALSLARREDKPILLSIGYSACHWCHVMAHESFEDPEVAAVMNRLFVNIKVDREERPDLDQIYQSAHQMLTGRAGGWPLTMFLTPDGSPFFGGTYFPSAPRYGLPGFTDLAARVAQSYREQRGEIEEQNGRLRQALASTVPAPADPGATLERGPLAALREYLAGSFDQQYGGFGKAPKFPHPTDLAFLLRRYAADGDSAARDMALATLRRMAEGGIHDQIGGGFCRYSVDERWEIPHFEKMLYDNGPLLGLYADAWAITGEGLFREAAEGIAAWAVREMQSPEGGYYSSLDADSEGEEGRFYVWSQEEFREVLDPEEYRVAARHWGLDGPPNFEAAHWHLRVSAALPESEAALLATARKKLFAVRERRIRPGRDEKVLSSWNALMIEGMAHAARIFGRPDWLASARRALDFIRNTLWRDGEATNRGLAEDLRRAKGRAPEEVLLGDPEPGAACNTESRRDEQRLPPPPERALGGGHLLATYKDGRAHLDAYLDDHALLIKALIELMQADFRSGDLEFAQALGFALLDGFADREDGGFFFTAHRHEALIHRPKPGHDNATPAGNGVAAFALQRLAHLTGLQAFGDAAKSTLRLFQPQFSRHSGGFASLLEALEDWLEPPRLVILRGPTDQVRDWQGRLERRYLPATLVLPLPNGLTGLPQILSKPEGDQVNAWVCSGVTCLAPVASWAEMERMLGEFP